MVVKRTSSFRSKNKENPFEKFANSKKKHEVVNRRVKGEDRNVGRARGKAVTVRKNKLVAEINASKKSNTFSDRRFGENNASLSLEEKMFLRFQQERVKKAKQSKFNLDAAEAPILTHKGQILGNSTLNDEWAESSDDENLGKDVVNQLHFGGGLVPSHRASDSVQNKTRADVLQDIVMKSKLYKLEKKEAKNAQEDQRELLDKAYTDLVQSASLEFKPTRRDRSEGNTEDADEYDKSLRVMAFESRVQPSDRTKTKEEIALSEYQKLAALEQERLKRMTPDYDEVGQRKRKFSTNDDCIEDFETNDIQDEPSVDSEDFESDSEDSSHADDDDDDDNEEVDEDQSEEDEDDDDEEEGEHPHLSFPSSNLSMPHSIECPQLLDDFKKLVNLYAGNAASFSVLLERILTWNSVHLPGAKVENEKKMAVFFEILVNYFIFRADSLPSSSTEDEVLPMLEHLSYAIFRLATDLSVASQSCFLKKLQSLQEKLTNELQFHAEGRQSSCWPSLGNVLFFQLLGGMQSLTDFRHCVVQPTQLLIAQCLVQCPISCLRDMSSGILLSGILSDYASKTHELIPELLIFLQRAFDFLLSSKKELDSFDLDVSVSLPWKVFLPTATLTDYSSSILHSLLALTDASVVNHQQESLLGLNLRLEQLLALDARQQISKIFPSLWAKYSEHLHPSPRKSLSWRPSKKVVEEMLTPAYEVDYKMKSTTPNANPEKLKLKVLNKQLKREQKASMRELRRDSEFLDQEYFAEKSKTLSEKKAERFRNYSWLEQEQATLNQQVRKSNKDPIKGGGSGGVPKKQRRTR